MELAGTYVIASTDNDVSDSNSTQDEQGIEAITPEGSDGGSGGGCFISTVENGSSIEN